MLLGFGDAVLMDVGSVCRLGTNDEIGIADNVEGDLLIDPGSYRCNTTSHSHKSIVSVGAVHSLIYSIY